MVRRCPAYILLSSPLITGLHDELFLECQLNGRLGAFRIIYKMRCLECSLWHSHFSTQLNQPGDYIPIPENAGVPAALLPTVDIFLDEADDVDNEGSTTTLNDDHFEALVTNSNGDAATHGVPADTSPVDPNTTIDEDVFNAALGRATSIEHAQEASLVHASVIEITTTSIVDAVVPTIDLAPASNESHIFDIGQATDGYLAAANDAVNQADIEDTLTINTSPVASAATVVDVAPIVKHAQVDGPVELVNGCTDKNLVNRILQRVSTEAVAGSISGVEPVPLPPISPRLNGLALNPPNGPVVFNPHPCSGLWAKVKRAITIRL